MVDRDIGTTVDGWHPGDRRGTGQQYRWEIYGSTVPLGGETATGGSRDSLRRSLVLLTHAVCFEAHLANGRAIESGRSPGGTVPAWC